MIDFDLATLLFMGATAIGSGGVSYGVTAVRSKDTRKDLDAHVLKDEAFHTDSIDRLARLETKIDLLLEERR